VLAATRDLCYHCWFSWRVFVGLGWLYSRFCIVVSSLWDFMGFNDWSVCVTMHCTFWHWVVFHCQGLHSEWCCSFSALSSPLCCGCLIEENKVYTLCALNNLCQAELEPYLLGYGPCHGFVPVHEWVMVLPICTMASEFSPLQRVVLLSLCWLRNKP